jgi:5-dehydro-2-deoxygluconokinase
VALRLAQEERVLELHRDCIALERELLLEVIASASGLPVDDHTIARSLQRFYNLGIRPAWWKLEPQSASGWSEIDRVIAASDPWCNGVLLLGLDASEEALRTAFATAAPFAVCRGFAVGRSIFGHAARDWVEESIDDATVIDAVAMRYERLIHLWQATRAQADGMAAGID